MIEKVSHNSGISPAADLTRSSASAKTLCHTPFGDVMIDKISPARLASVSPGGEARSALAGAWAAVATSATPAARAQVAAHSARATSVAQVAAHSVSATSVAAVLPTTHPAAREAAAAAVPVAQPAAPAVQPTAAVATDSTAEDACPTAQSVFGPNPWMTNPTGTNPDGSTFGYNPLYFATPATAAKVAQIMGGTVVASDQLADAGGFAQQQPNEMVQLPNGTLVNAGLMATFYTYGFPQSYIDLMLARAAGGDAA